MIDLPNCKYGKTAGAAAFIPGVEEVMFCCLDEDCQCVGDLEESHAWFQDIENYLSSQEITVKVKKVISPKHFICSIGK